MVRPSSSIFLQVLHNWDQASSDFEFLAFHLLEKSSLWGALSTLWGLDIKEWWLWAHAMREVSPRVLLVLPRPLLFLLASGQEPCMSLPVHSCCRGYDCLDNHLVYQDWIRLGHRWVLYLQLLLLCTRDFRYRLPNLRLCLHLIWALVEKLALDLQLMALWERTRLLGREWPQVDPSQVFGPHDLDNRSEPRPVLCLLPRLDIYPVNDVHAGDPRPRHSRWDCVLYNL